MRNTFEKEFIKLKDELASFVFRLLTNREDTEDIVQNTFIKVSEKIDSFKGKSTFRTWVFSIALNLSKNHLKTKKRWSTNFQDKGASLHSSSSKHWYDFKKVFKKTPESEYEIKEHINYCFNCMNKTLLLKQQICLLLKDVYGFRVRDIVEITRYTEGIVKHSLAEARKNMIDIFDNRCAFVNKEGTCHQCTTLTGALNPKQNAHIKAQQLKLVQEGNHPNKEYLLQLRLEIVEGIDPLNSKNSILNTYMLENSEKWSIEKNLEKKS